MRSAVAWCARNPVASNLLMIVLMVAGTVSALSIKTELFPEFSLDTVVVSVIYPGAAPEEVEEGICVPIEEEVHAIEGVKEISSTASEGVGSVMIEVLPGSDPRRVLEDVKTRVDAIDTFPEEAERPVIEEILIRRQVINVAIYGDVEEAALKTIGERLRDRLSELPEISQVDLASVRPYEISIEVSEDALRRFGLTFDDVANAVRRSSLDLSGGSVKTAGGEILLRTVGQAYRGDDFAEAVVVTRPDGTRILVGDVATVIDGFEDTDQDSQFDGKPVAMLQVFRIGDENALEVAAAVTAFVESVRPELPEGIELATWQNSAEMLESRLDLLIRNGAQGLVLVLLVLALFLRFRLAFWVTLGIPISFLGTFMVMPWFDQSVNMLSLFAFLLVLGIVVDDAIVVGENIFRERGKAGADESSAVRGVQGVAIPVVFAVLTTILAFLPMTALPGVMGKFFSVIPMAVIPALIFSLIESQFILPAHLAHESKLLTRLGSLPPFSWWTALQGLIGRGLNGFIQRVYAPTLHVAVRWRYATMALAISTLLISAGTVAGGFLKFVFFPEVEGDVLAAQLTMPEGTSAQTTAQAVRRIEEAAAKLRAEIEQGQEGSAVRHFMASVGEQPYLSQQQSSRNPGAGIIGGQYGEVVIELVPSEERDLGDLTAVDITNRWRELTGPIPGATQLTFSSALMSAGDPISVRFSGLDIQQLRAAAAEFKGLLANYPGVFDARDSFRGGKEELVLDVQPGAEALGLSRLDLARQVRQGFYGEEAQRIQRGRDELKVMVRYPEADRRSLFGLESMRVRTSVGEELPFSAVAEVDTRRGYATIKRSERRRTVDVTANVDTSRGNPNEIVKALQAEVLPELLHRYPGVSYTLEGQSSEQAETIQTMARLFLLALFGIYAVMAIPFKSYVQPLIVMIAIPFGLVGALAGHLVIGMSLSMMSVLGLVALAGVVVNDSLVLVDYVNQLRAEGKSVLDAVTAAGLQRFRPILLTSMTTFAGLTPLLLERSVQAQFLVPMAVSLAFGVLFATAITLILVPAIYLILEDLTAFPRWLYGSSKAAAGEPAAQA